MTELLRVLLDAALLKMASHHGIRSAMDDIRQARAMLPTTGDVGGVAERIKDEILEVPFGSTPEALAALKCMEIVDKHVAAIPALSQGWLPIESAPKDGTEILVNDDGRDTAVYAWYCQVFSRWESAFGFPNSTHWMPLPTAPKQEG